MKFLKLIFPILICYTSLLSAQEIYQYQQPEKIPNDWETEHLDSLNIDTGKLFSLLNKLKMDPHKIHSVLLVKNEKIVLEEYYGDYTIDTPHDMRSVTKSFRSILLGIAIEKGFIKSVNDPISTYLKDLTPKKNLDPRKEKITIAHLLTMSSGLECNDWDKKSKGQEDKVSKKKDWLQYTLDLPVVNEPGTVSNYCSMGIVLLAKIISNASGMTIEKFAQKYLFDPLEIKNIQWGHTSNKKVISAGKRLYMVPRDMAKIGKLIKNKGTWNDTQIVSSEWIEESISPKTKITGIDYGYLWWTIPFQGKTSKINATVATGNGGQYIMVFPDQDLIAIFTGGVYNSQEDKAPFAIMNKIVLPTFLN